MDEDHDHIISVTHFINPHLFWYRKIGGPDDNFHVLTQLEQKLDELYKNKPITETRCRPAVGDKVAVNFVVWNKFIRAEVLQKAEFQQEEFIVWALDYGFPLLTKKEHVRKLPEALAAPVGQIHRGGLFDLQPAVLDYDHVESNLVMVKQDEWLQRACDMLEKLLADAASIIFVEQFQSADEHHWGDLIISNHKGNKFNARTYLKSAKYAMEVDSKIFPQICSGLKTTNIAPWLSNSRKTKLKFNSIKHNIAEHSQQMNSAIIDECAKRKVQDWCERNAREQDGTMTVEHLESGAESVHDQVIDDITFDDSVSVIHQKMKIEQKASKSSHYHRHHQQQQQRSDEADDHVNYMGKAGALTKLKQQKYASKHNLPPQAHSNAFNMDFVSKSNNPFDFAFDKPMPAAAAPTVISSASSSTTNVSTRIRRMAELRAERAKKLQQEQQHQQKLCSSDFNTDTSMVSSNGGGGSTTLSSRQQKLAELRKKHSRPELDKKLMPDAAIKPVDSKNSTASAPSTKTVSSHTQRLLGMRQKELSITLDNDESTTDEARLQPVPAPRKRPKKANSEKDEHDVELQNALNIIQKPCDEYQIFGDFVASELRGLTKPGSKRKLKRLIQQAILQVSGEDDEADSDMIIITSDASGCYGLGSSTQSSVILPCNTSTQGYMCSDNAQDIGTEPHNIPAQSLRSYIRGFETDT